MAPGFFGNPGRGQFDVLVAAREHRVRAQGGDDLHHALHPVDASTGPQLPRDHQLVLIGGALGARTLDADGVKALAELPSLDELRAKLAGLIATPATRIAGVLQAPAGQLARVFGAFATKGEGEAAAA